MLAEPAVVVLLAHLDDEPVGYVSAVLQLNLWFGGELVAMDDHDVRAPALDRGVGSQLLLALADLAAPRNLLITWGVAKDNDAGHRFYQRPGATLHTKVVASQQPRTDRVHLDSRV